MSHQRGRIKNRGFQSNGDFTEGFEFFEDPKKAGGSYKESGWIPLKEFYPHLVYCVQNECLIEFEVTSENKKKHKISQEECELILNHYLSEVFSAIENLGTSDKLQLLNQPFVNAMSLPLSIHQKKELKLS